MNVVARKNPQPIQPRLSRDQLRRLQFRRRRKRKRPVQQQVVHAQVRIEIEPRNGRSLHAVPVLHRGLEVAGKKIDRPQEVVRIAVPGIEPQTPAQPVLCRCILLLFECHSGQFDGKTLLPRALPRPRQQNSVRFPQPVQMPQRHPIVEIDIARPRHHRRRQPNHLGPLLLPEQLPYLRIRRRAGSGTLPPASRAPRQRKNQREDDAGTASSIQLPVALQSFSNAARSWDSSLRSAGSFIVTSPRPGSTPSTTT